MSKLKCNDIDVVCTKCGGDRFKILNSYEIKCMKCGRVSEYHDITAVPDSQAEKADNGKPKLSLVPRHIIFDIARVREYGNNKYPEGGVDNWRRVEASRYRDALFRHFMAYLDDPYGCDDESGLPHLWHLATNVAFLCDLEDPIIEEKSHE